MFIKNNYISVMHERENAIRKSSVGNVYDKYHSKNPFVKYAIKRFLRKINQCLESVNVSTILDCGCAEGYLSDYIHNLKHPSHMSAVDIDEPIIKKAKMDYPAIDFLSTSIYKLPYKDNSFDLVIALEVLEHIDFIEYGLSEIIRVGKRYFLFSVPREPYWHLINLLGGKYYKRLGNTPGHVQFWTRGSFLRYMRHKFIINKFLSSFPWTILLCEKL